MLHLKRFGMLLALGLVAFLGARGASTVASFEFIGLVHNDDAEVWATRPLIYQNPEECAECHEGMYNGWKSQAHQVVTCENCHGGAREHIFNARNKLPALFPLADAKDICLTCHLEIGGRPLSFPMVNPLKHPGELPGAACTTCHTPHNPAYPPKYPHALQGRETCLVCHGPEGWKPASPSHKDRGADTCLKCHTYGPKEEEGD